MSRARVAKSAPPEQKRRIAPLAAAALALVGIAVSSALLVDSLQPEPAFCSADGCAAVRATAWARPLGVPMPFFGIGFFTLALALIAAGPRASRARSMVVLAGALGAVGLIAVQAFVIGEWCRWCVVVDLAAIALAVLVVAGGSAAWPRAGGRAIAAATVLAVAAIAVPLSRYESADGMQTVRASSGASAGIPSSTSQGGLPKAIAREQVPGTVVVVDFIDFQCPHCRTLHPRLVEALSRFQGQVKVVRKMMPLPNHPGAMPAAVAYVAAEAQGKGAEMAEALLAAPVEELTREGCEKLAASLGLDMKQYRTAAQNPDTRGRIHTDIQDAKSVGLTSLPTIYIGREVFRNAQASTEELEAALRRAAAAAN
jgi:uncharacterized membrane protein/predicted DsbA family dithiol-disulfide isomerase